MDTDALKNARQQVADLERAMFDDIQAKAALLGYELMKNGTIPPNPVPKKVKYRGPNGEEWSGRGKRPAWLKEALNAGRQLEDFAI